MLDVERTSHYLLWRILGGANGFHRRGISRRQQSTKGGIWTFNFQLTANEVGGGGGQKIIKLKSLMEYQVNLIVTQPVVSFIFGSFSQNYQSRSILCNFN